MGPRQEADWVQLGVVIGVAAVDDVPAADDDGVADRRVGEAGLETRQVEVRQLAPRLCGGRGRRPGYVRDVSRRDLDVDIPGFDVARSRPELLGE